MTRPVAVRPACIACPRRAGHIHARDLRSLRRDYDPWVIWNHNIHYHPVLLDALPPHPHRVLDVGCGDGILAADLVRRGIPEVVAIDVDAPVLRRARFAIP